jgi:hypothetical protein
MNCQRFENVVSDLARDQMMEADIREQALAHSNECQDCARRLRNEERLTQGLRSVVDEMSVVVAPASVESKLLQAFRDRPVAVPVVVNHGHRRYWVAAAAAVLLIVFGAMAMRWRANVSTPPPLQATNEPKQVKDDTAPSPTPINVSGKDEPQKKMIVPKRHRNEFTARNESRRSRPAERPVANHAEVTTEFIPVGYLSVANFQEGGQIVRVEVPRSRLVSFGVPVNMERSHEKVKADVLVGVDGLARAIRFVQVVDKN